MIFEDNAPRCGTDVDVVGTKHTCATCIRTVLKEASQLDKCNTGLHIILMKICGNYGPKCKPLLDMRKMVSNREIFI
jgi:hypothetical protein